MLAASSYSSAFAMSYPYQPYQQSYSNHSTPPSFWDTDQQLQQQQDPLQVAVIEHQPSISPQVYQQQLSPVESVISLDQQFQQPQSAYDSPRTIQIQERVQPSQFRFDNIDESHFLQQQENTEPRLRSTSKAVSRVSGGGDEPRSSTTSPGSRGATGPSRVPHGKAQAPHPYRRPSVTSPTVGTPSKSASGVRSTSSSTRAQRQRDSDVLGERVSRLSYAASPTVGSSMAVACPAMHTWRLSSFPALVDGGDSAANQPLGTQGGENTADSPEHTSTTKSVQDQATSAASTGKPPAAMTQPSVGTVHPLGPPMQARPQVAKRLLIRTDVHFDPTANEMTAVFELPGIKKQDLTIRMHVCPYSRVRQLTVMGRSRPTLPDGMYTVQERKFGDFYRTVVVPLDTKPEDIVATMEDGILILKVPCGTPPEQSEEPQEIKIQ